MSLVRWSRRWMCLCLLADVAPKVFPVDTGSFLAIVVTGAVAGTVAAIAGRPSVLAEVVVLELVLGVVIGPQGLDIAHVNDFTQFFSDLGLGMLFFFAGCRSTSRAFAAVR